MAHTHDATERRLWKMHRDIRSIESMLVIHFLRNMEHAHDTQIMCERCDNKAFTREQGTQTDDKTLHPIVQCLPSPTRKKRPAWRRGTGDVR